MKKIAHNAFSLKLDLHLTIPNKKIQIMKCLILTSVQLRITKLLIDQILTKIVVPWGGRTIGGLGRIGRPRSMENRVQLK